MNDHPASDPRNSEQADPNHDCFGDREEMIARYKALRAELESVKRDYAGMCQVVRDRDAELERVKAIRFKELYYELLYSVGNKFPNETRHQTALRYIRNAENKSDSAGKAAQSNEDKP